IAVVSNHGAIYGTYAGLNDLLSEEIEGFHGAGLSLELLRGGGGFGLACWRFGRRVRGGGGRCRRSGGLIGIMVGAHGGIARTEDQNIAVKDAGGVDFAICNNICCPGEGLDWEKGVGRRGGCEFGVGGGCKKF